MILSSHIIGASAVSLVFKNGGASAGNIAKIFAISFLSHYALDAIPHWDYDLSSIIKLPPDKEGIKTKKFIFDRKLISKDLFKNSLDGLLGLAGVFLIYGFPKNYQSAVLIFAIVSGAILPDLLEVLYLIFKKFPLTLIHKFHNFIHGQRIFLNKPVLGILSQIISFGTIIFFLFAFQKFF